MEDHSIDMEDYLRITDSIWEVTVSIWDILSLWCPAIVYTVIRWYLLTRLAAGETLGAQRVRQRQERAQNASSGVQGHTLHWFPFQLMGVRAKPWCLLIHAKASLSRPVQLPLCIFERTGGRTQVRVAGARLRR
jgi:hypothetical protein